LAGPEAEGIIPMARTERDRSSKPDHALHGNPDGRIREGEPYPLGVRWNAETGVYNFALFSRHATAVTLLLYTAEDVEHPALTVPLRHPAHKSGRVWHCAIPLSAVGRARHYGYRVEGPWDPPRHLFDPEKVLLDPYARGVHFPLAFSREAATGRGNNAGRAALGTLPRPGGRHQLPSFHWDTERRPHHGAEAVIYELHVRGFTRHPSSGVAPERRGTFAGVIEKIPYLKELGVTTVELLPVFQFDPQEGNFWGYMPLGFFSVHQQYSTGGTAAAAFDEFRAMVRALHEVDIEVILDVVYNHTVERGVDGPTYSFRGIDNSSYYLLTPDLADYRDDAGCGNVLRCAHPAVRRLILDSLHFWVSEMHVDGFTLYDLVSYERKRNEANGHDNSDGTNDNRSWNCGWEGDDGVPEEVLERRIRQAKNYVTILFLASGTPMVRAGDEFLQTQGGNNNAYNQDNETSWLDWSRRERFPELHHFFRGMIAFRCRHPNLARTRFWRDDVCWHGAAPEAAGRPDTSPASRTLAYYLHGRAVGDEDLYVMLNASPDPVLFTVHEGEPEQWRRVIDTSIADADAIAEPGGEPPLAAPDYRVDPHSVVVLLRAGAEAPPV
jgi:pullulanase/glycogen debranching enzyme